MLLDRATGKGVEEALFERFTERADVLGVGSTRVIQIPDPADLDAEEEHLFARMLVPALLYVVINFEQIVARFA